MTVRLYPLVACFALVGCAAPTEEEALQPDEATAQSEDEVRIGDCKSTTGEGGKLYSFEGGNFRVCLNTDHVGGTRFGMGTPTGIRHC